MFVTQKKPNGWTLFFAFTEIAFGLWAFVAGLLAMEAWQILFDLAMVTIGQQTGSSYLFRLGLFEKYRLFLIPELSGEQAERQKEYSAKQDQGTLA